MRGRWPCRLGLGTSFCAECTELGWLLVNFEHRTIPWCHNVGKHSRARSVLAQARSPF